MCEIWRKRRDIVRWIARYKWHNSWRAALVPDVDFGKAVEVRNDDTDIARVEVWEWL
jgi:hypothetical protein